MCDKLSFSVIGGDDRSLKLAKLLGQDGYEVYAAGFENAPDKPEFVVYTDIVNAVFQGNTIILPLPVTVDRQHLNAPFSKKHVLLDDDFANLLSGKKVFAGVTERLQGISESWDSLCITDYYKSEPLQIKNALATAEGALAIVISNTDFSVFGIDCLITGYGRIGKIMAKYMSAVGARVSVSARDDADLAWIYINGHKPLRYGELDSHLTEFQVIINTVPKLLFDKKRLFKISPSCVIVDLASKPGGVDTDAAKKLGIKVITALGIPGEFCPLTSARYIKETIIELSEEAEKWKE